MGDPQVSVILPTWNGERDLERLLPALALQELAVPVELRAIDSSSTDRTRELLAAAGAHVEVIPKESFRHGPSRNRCAAGARGRTLVFLSQDAEPADAHFLSELLAPFAEERVAGVYARCLPHPSDDPLTTRTALSAPEASEEPAAADLDDVAVRGGLGALSPAERSRILRFNNVASAIRADVFRQLPFPDLAFGEDLGWAERALEEGHRLAYAPRAVVYHAHAYGPREAYARYRTDALYHRLVFDHEIRPSVASALRGLAYEVRADLAHLARQRPPAAWRWALRSPFLRAAQVFGQYRGSRASLETCRSELGGEESG